MIATDDFVFGSDSAADAELVAEIRAAYDRAVWLHCGFASRCAIEYDPVAKRILGGFGAVGCPCESLPGRGARHPEQLSKPAWPHKVRGRHGSRVQRSRRRHAGIGRSGLMRWVEEMYAEFDAREAANERKSV